MDINEEHLIRMFDEVHGEMSRSCSREIYLDDDGLSVAGIKVIKNGCVCWHTTITEIMFEYITLEWR